MGLGYFLTEKLVYDTNTGALLTHNTWVCACMNHLPFLFILVY